MVRNRGRTTVTIRVMVAPARATPAPSLPPVGTALVDPSADDEFRVAIPHRLLATAVRRDATWAVGFDAGGPSRPSPVLAFDHRESDPESARRFGADLELHGFSDGAAWPVAGELLVGDDQAEVDWCGDGRRDVFRGLTHPDHAAWVAQALQVGEIQVAYGYRLADRYRSQGVFGPYPVWLGVARIRPLF